MAKALEPLDAALLVSPMPVANRVVVEQQGLRDALAAPTLVEKDNGVGSPGHAMLLKPVSGKPDQSSTVCRRKKPAANHVHSRILIDSSVKSFFRLFNESRYIREK